jgi:hypothetical protein
MMNLKSLSLYINEFYRPKYKGGSQNSSDFVYAFLNIVAPFVVQSVAIVVN